MNDLDVATGVGEPAEQPLAPVPAADPRPVAEHLEVAPFREVRRRGADDPLADRVPAQPAVAELQRILGRDHERGIGHDEVERLVAGRIEEVARGGLDVVNPVELGVEPGHDDGPRVEVRGHHLPAVGRRLDRQEAAPGAQVERPSRRPADGDPGEALRRTGDPEDVIVPLPAVGERAIVGDHQPVRAP